MDLFDTIFSGRDEKTYSNSITASEGIPPRENAQQAEIRSIISNLAAKKTAWLRDEENSEVLKAWAGLR